MIFRQETQHFTWRVRMHMLRLLAFCWPEDLYQMLRTMWVFSVTFCNDLQLHRGLKNNEGSHCFDKHLRLFYYRWGTHVCMWLLATTTWLLWKSCWVHFALWQREIRSSIFMMTPAWPSQQNTQTDTSYHGLVLWCVAHTQKTQKTVRFRWIVVRQGSRHSLSCMIVSFIYDPLWTITDFTSPCTWWR